MQGVGQALRQFETQALIERQQVGVAKQPGWPVSLGQRRLHQFAGYPLLAPLRVDEQAGQPETPGYPGQAQPGNDPRPPGYPQLRIACRAHARALLPVKVVQQPAFCICKCRAG